MGKGYDENGKVCVAEHGTFHSSCRWSPRPFVLVDSKKQNVRSSLASSASLSKPQLECSEGLISPPPSTAAISLPSESIVVSDVAGKSARFPAGRYRSPTDSIISPISRGLLIKGRKAVKTFQEIIPPQVLESKYNDDARKP
ncbi:hypothetical protein KP509_01G061800 [Ceratopteris richardii]|uniref:Uncharacterized protein n=1 Tax=Ceratopteris richardii TaxID=49495 RepID=A0A8T2VLU5_CERRI|nr:hypothetical protein KP509_01G061800 [Ceratopteris richardii]